MALEYKSSLGRYRRYLQTLEHQPIMAKSLWVIFSLVLLIVMVMAALRPTLITIADLLSQTKSKKLLREQLDNKIVTVQKAMENLEQNGDKALLLYEAIPSQPEWNLLANRIMAAASNSGVKIEAIQMGPIDQITTQTTNTGPGGTGMPKLPAGIKYYPFRVNINGDYEALKKTVEELENLKRIIVVTEVKFEKNVKGQLSVSINGLASYDNVDNLGL